MFLVRLRTSVLIMAVAITSMAVGGYLLFFVMLAISLIGMMELYRIVSIHKTIAGGLGYLSCICFYLLLLQNKGKDEMILILSFLLLLMIVYVFTFPKYQAEQIAMVFFGFFYVAVLLSFLYQIRIQEGGAYVVWLAFIGAWGSDTCAYLAGRAFGKHKIAPVLSPKKTLEGCIGGVLGAGLLGFVYAFIFKEQLFMLENPTLLFPLIAAASSILSQIGDMAASGMKRNKGIKDYGNLMPGHGGILDRFDSILFTAPICFYLMYFLG